MKHDPYAIERLVAPLIERQGKIERDVERLQTRSVGHVSSGARVYNNANLPITNATLTALTFNTERYDTHAFHSTSVNTSRLTVPAAGRYFAGGNVIFASNATGIRQVYIRLNGTTYIAQIGVDAVSTDATVLDIETVWLCAAGDYVELVVYQSSGGSLNVEVHSARSPEFYIERVA